MDFIRDNIRHLYFKLLAPSLVGAFAISIYSFIDTIAVGQSTGVHGTAAMAVIAPIYGVMVFLSLLCGVGGSVLMSVARGEEKKEKGDEFFTAACILMAIITVVIWAAFLIFRDPIFRLFGANDDIMANTIDYGQIILWAFPLFIFPIFIPAFIRNDGAPKLVMAAVLIGGGINMFGDWFLVFPLKMGMKGAALATVIGSAIQSGIMLWYFFRKRCTLKFAKPEHIGKAFVKILRIGIGASALDLGTIIIGIVTNNQILKYGGTTELAIFGVMITILSLLQAVFGGVGQALQPLASSNFGAKQPERIRKVWKYALITTVIMGLIFTALGELFPVPITKIFMDADAAVLAGVPRAFHFHFAAYVFLGVTVLAAYYLQSIMQEGASLVVGFAHSLVVTNLLCYLLPLIFGMDGVWLSFPLAELIIAVFSVIYISYVNRKKL